MDCLTVRCFAFCFVLLVLCPLLCFSYTADQVFKFLSGQLTSVEITVDIYKDKIEAFEERYGDPKSSESDFELPEISQKIEQKLQKNIQQRTLGLSRAFTKEKLNLQALIGSARLEYQADLQNKIGTLEKKISANLQSNVVDIKRILHGTESKTNTDILELHTALNKERNDVDELATKVDTVSQGLDKVTELTNKMESLLKANQKQGLDTITELASRIESRLTAIQHEVENLKNITEDAIICERLKGHIECAQGQKITVYYANYGRTHNGTICPPGPTSNPNCRAADSYTRIYNACNN